MLAQTNSFVKGYIKKLKKFLFITAIFAILLWYNIRNNIDWYEL